MKKFLQYTAVVVLALACIAPILLSYFAGGWAARYNPHSKVYTSTDLTGKVAIVTGGNTGIGRQTVLELARCGARVILACRNQAQGKAAVAELADQKGVQVDVLQLELGDFDSVRAFAKEFADLNTNRLDILILNAGVMLGRPMGAGAEDAHFQLTKSGFEAHIGINHLGHALLTRLLFPHLGEGSRVVSVSSGLEMASYRPEGFLFEAWHRQIDRYTDGKGYAQSKLANIMFTQELAERFGESKGTKFVSCHPGIIKTDLGRHIKARAEQDAKEASFAARIGMGALKFMFELAQMDAREGALTQLWLATSEYLDFMGNKNGRYFAPIARLDTPQHPQAGNATLRQRLWRETEAIVGIFE